MTSARRSGQLTVAVFLLATLPAAAAVPCDPEGADQPALAAVWAAVDAACPCATATSHGAHVSCAGAVVKQHFADGSLPSRCRGVARGRASRSTCGTPGARVCCRHDGGGRLRARIVLDPARCAPRPGGTACLADPPTVVDGCTATGCVACGNGVVDPGETCEPPGTASCTATCQIPPVCGDGIVEPGEECELFGPVPCTIGCHLPVCGNGVVEPGEDCEPPGTATCNATCRSNCGNGILDPGEVCEPTDPTTCTPTCDGTCGPGSGGETVVACASASTSPVALAAGGPGALLAYPTIVPGRRQEIFGRRLDPAGVPLDQARITISRALDGSVPDLAFSHGSPGASGDAEGWYVGWVANATIAPVQSVRGVRVAPDGAVSGEHELDERISIGMCSSFLSGPVSVASRGVADVAVEWLDRLYCFPYGSIADVHVVATVSFPGGVPAIGSRAALDPVVFPQPAELGQGDGVVAAGGGDTVVVAAYVAADWSSGTPDVVDQALRAYWIGGTGPQTTRLTSVSSGFAGGVAWGGTSFLAAWASETGIRMLRFTRAAGPLDPDGGLLLASDRPIGTAPVVAFAGGRWLVVWLERPTPTSYDLRAVAVDGDGTVLDPTPRLLASDVSFLPPAVTASGGDVLVAFGRTEGALAQSLRTIAVAP